MRADWPLGRLTVDTTSLRINVLILGTVVEIPWETVSSIEGTWTELEVRYNHQEEHRELSLYAPFLWWHFESRMTSRGSAISDLLTQTPKTGVPLRDDVD